MLEYLVTGTGRCGTTFMAKCLTLAGSACSHEAIYHWRGQGLAPENSSSGRKAGLPDPRSAVGEASMFAAPFAPSFAGKVVHLTRHPLKVVRSFVNDMGLFTEAAPKAVWMRKTQDFLVSHVPGITGMPDPMSRAAHFYVEWNRIIEASGNRLHHRIEDPPQPVLAFLGANSDAPFGDTRCNSHAKPDSPELTWGDVPHLVRDDLQRCARRYGYRD